MITIAEVRHQHCHQLEAKPQTMIFLLLHMIAGRRKYNYNFDVDDNYDDSYDDSLNDNDDNMCRKHQR